MTRNVRERGCWAREAQPPAQPPNRRPTPHLAGGGPTAGLGGDARDRLQACGDGPGQRRKEALQPAEQPPAQ